VFYPLHCKEAYLALSSDIASGQLAYGCTINTHSHLSRLVIDHLYAVGYFSCELDEVLVRRVLVNVVIPVLCALELNNKAMCVRVLQRASVAIMDRMSLVHLQHVPLDYCFFRQRMT
jgi:hypothetical protein